ncbi:MAG: hypothetical protein EP329_12495 [Deltaproteobacteria bacterium]|nr:MAG: hypothetical protein EP329_12495 [Deltaproteobacteria bacterium]
MGASPPPSARPLGRVLRGLARVALVGLLPGALFYAGMFGLSVAFHADAEYLGVKDEAVTSRLIDLFHDQIIAQQLGLLALYLAIGAAVGLAAFGFVEVARRGSGRPYRALRHLYWVVLATFLVHSWFLVWSIGHHPAMYEPQTHNSTYLAVLFWLGTDVLPRPVVEAAPFALAAVAVALLVRLAVRSRGGLGLRHPADERLPLVGPAAAGVFFGVVARLVFGASAAAPPAASGERPNVLIIAVDSLRADVLARDPAVTPSIDAFARSAVSFDAAYSVMPRTFPAWASILTGKYPHHHGVRNMFPAPRPGLIIADGLPEVLARAGYRTAVVSDFAGDVFVRGDFGFAHVDAPEFTLASNVRLGGLKLHVHLLPYLVEVARGAGHPDLLAFERLGDPSWLTDRALDWLDEGGRPFFLTVFYSSGHFPFAAPAPYYDRFTDPGYRGRSRFHKATIGSPLPDPAERAREERHIRGLYQGAVAASDAAIGQLLAGLDARGLRDDTLVVVTADHGEMLYEDGLGVGHGDHLYGRGTLNVPLVIRWPGLARPGTHIPTAVPLVDLAPTVLARLGLPAPAGVDGVDQGPVIAGDVPPTPRPIFAETGLTFFPPETDRVDDRVRFASGFSAFRFAPDTWAIYLDPKFEAVATLAKQRVLIAGDRKLVYVPTRDGVRLELYDTVNDPGDRHDLAAAEPSRLAALERELYAWLAEDPGVVLLGDFVAPREPLGDTLDLGVAP